MLVDLRLLGLGLRRQPIAVVAREAQPWLLGGLAVMIAPGMLPFLSEAVTSDESPPFCLADATRTDLCSLGFALDTIKISTISYNPYSWS